MELKSKLSRAIGMISKIRHYVKPETLRLIYYGIFSSILMYGSQIWGQHNSIVKNLQKFQNKDLRIMNFCPPRTSATPLFKSNEILKLTDNISLQNFLYAHDSLNGNLSTSIQGKLSFVNTVNNTRNQTYFQLDRIKTKTTFMVQTVSNQSPLMSGTSLINYFTLKKFMKTIEHFAKNL